MAAVEKLKPAILSKFFEQVTAERPNSDNSLPGFAGV